MLASGTSKVHATLIRSTAEQAGQHLPCSFCRALVGHSRRGMTGQIRTASVHGPLTSSGFKTFCQRCRHCTSVRSPPKCSAMAFQFLPPNSATACCSFSSCSIRGGIMGVE